MLWEVVSNQVPLDLELSMHTIAPPSDMLSDQ